MIGRNLNNESAHTVAPEGHNSPSGLPAIRAKAERIVSLLSGIDIGDAQAANSLSLAEELAQEIADLCPMCGGLGCPSQPDLPS